MSSAMSMDAIQAIVKEIAIDDDDIVIRVWTDEHFFGMKCPILTRRMF